MAEQLACYPSTSRRRHGLLRVPGLQDVPPFSRVREHCPDSLERRSPQVPIPLLHEIPGLL